jgi:hypothetical protein
MPHPDETAGSNKDLLGRATAASLNSARIIAHSIATVMRSIEIAKAVALTCKRASIIRTETMRAKAAREDLAGKQRAANHVDQGHSLPLTPSKLLEVAEEFRSLARSAATPESRAAFENLVFHYTALAAGFDDERTGSRMLH